ncbi:MAG: hypothetical protein ACOWWM_17225 [Desulfobacterales bacterium]
MQETSNGIRVDLGSAGFPDVWVDIYALKSNPDHVRAKIQKKIDDTEAIESELKRIRMKLQNELLGVATVGAFASLGQRSDVHYFYAHIQMAKKTGDLSVVQKGAKQALDQLKEVDAKSFRLGLDEIGLPRSSQLRLALTRIFRESADIEEMLTVLVQEAGVIAKTDEWKTLKDIKEENQIPHMSIIVELFWKAVAKERLIKTLEDIHN